MAAATHPTLADALSAFQAEAPTFRKSKTAKVKLKTGGEYTYKYADLGDILPVVGPLLAKHGLSWSSKPARGEDGDLLLRYRLLHSSGEADGDEMPLGVERNCKPQELGSAITYARRYALTAQLNLATDEDDDGQAAQQAGRPGQRRASTGEANGSAGQAIPLATPADVTEMKSTAEGLTPDQVRLALAACGISGVTAYNKVPAEKVVPLIKALGTMEREASA